MREDRRSAIVSAACDLVDQTGVAGLTMRRLGEAIGFTPPVIYEHFAGKTDVIAAVADAALGRLADAAASARKGAGDALAAVAEAYLGFARLHPGLMEAVHTAGKIDGPGATAMTGEMAAVFRTLDPTISRETAKVRTEAVWSTLQGIITLTEQGHIDQGRVDVVLDEVLAAFRAAWRS